MIEFDAFSGRLEDFWGRRGAQGTSYKEFRIFGYPVRLVSNDERIAAAIELLQPMYSKCSHVDREPWQIQFVVRRPTQHRLKAIPENLMQYVVYTGESDWLMWQIGEWGQIHVDLTKFQATAVISPLLAARPDLISQVVLHTILLNFSIASGFGMLHTSCLVKDGNAILLMAPHNTGKSTTALRLALAGFKFVSDSMIFVRPETYDLVGFPVGKVKLRGDMLPHFPELQSSLEAEYVRNETKYRLDLRQINPNYVHDTAVDAENIVLCLMKRWEFEETTVFQESSKQAWEAVVQNSLYYDSASIWQKNMSQLEQLMSKAKFCTLTIGTDQDVIVTAVAGLLN